jgi:hypothetical protein
MGAISGLVGAGGGAAGTSFAGPASGTILNPTTVGQANTAYSGNQQALAQQQALLQALQAQNGLQNQSNVYNQLQQVVSGQGPNPAQAQLAQSTGANTANQAALMAGQRGAGQNVGLIARQAAQQGGANQQAAAGQAATMQAQQSLNALGQAQGLATTQAGQQIGATTANTQAQQGEQATLLNSIAQQNGANVQMQSNINSVNAGLANTQMQGQQNLIGGVINGGAGALAMAKGGVVKNFADGGWTQQGPAQSYAGNDVSYNQQPAQDLSSLPGAYNTAMPQAQQPSPPTAGGAKSGIGKFMKGVGGSMQPNAQGQPAQSPAMFKAGNALGSAIGKGIGAIFSSSPQSTPAAPPTPQAGDQSSQQMDNSGVEAGGAAGGQQFAKGGKVPAMVSPGERYLPPKEVEKVAKGEKSPLKAGEKIPGKAKVKGDSLKNDTVPKTLEEGGIVLPKSVMESKHPHWEAHKFVSNILRQQGLHSKKK